MQEMHELSSRSLEWIVSFTRMDGIVHYRMDNIVLFTRMDNIVP